MVRGEKTTLLVIHISEQIGGLRFCRRTASEDEGMSDKKASKSKAGGSFPQDSCEVDVVQGGYASVHTAPCAKLILNQRRHLPRLANTSKTHLPHHLAGHDLPGGPGRPTRATTAPH